MSYTNINSVQATASLNNHSNGNSIDKLFEFRYMYDKRMYYEEIKRFFFTSFRL